MSAAAHPLPEGPAPLGSREGHDELVLARAVPFSSLCQHHLPPFVGIARVGYQATGARTVTSALHGLLRGDPSSRRELFALTPTAT